ncbi:hypothetical protein BC936DRAFT_143185 [Jimgerdemannia flammicorona]|uniref:Uncharacterized protein n=1 Tax=Jimgerdemannia flammicorona TaxID=994334 RepID=A0A433DEA8_9FUNG|nr:hypothetical protein BC936DRAFT_143185 [Jimgerdemannia flammicorona]
MKVPSLVHSLHPSIEMLESPASTVHVMALRSGNRSRRWKSPSTPNTPARSAGRTPSSVPLSASGTARPARRSSLVAPGPSLQLPPLPSAPPSVVSASCSRRKEFSPQKFYAFSCKIKSIRTPAGVSAMDAFGRTCVSNTRGEGRGGGLLVGWLGNSRSMVMVAQLFGSRLWKGVGDNRCGKLRELLNGLEMIRDNRCGKLRELLNELEMIGIVVRVDRAMVVHVIIYI